MSFLKAGTFCILLATDYHPLPYVLTSALDLGRAMVLCPLLILRRPYSPIPRGRGMRRKLKATRWLPVLRSRMDMSRCRCVSRSRIIHYVIVDSLCLCELWRLQSAFGHFEYVALTLPLPCPVRKQVCCHSKSHYFTVDYSSETAYQFLHCRKIPLGCEVLLWPDFFCAFLCLRSPFHRGVGLGNLRHARFLPLPLEDLLYPSSR